MLILVYMLSGAAIFLHIERDSLMEVAEEAAREQRNASQHLWNITLRYNVLAPHLSRAQVSQVRKECRKYMDSLIVD